MFPNPAITGTAIVKSLDPNQATAHHHDTADAQAAIDEADLHEMELAEYYDDAAAAETPASQPRPSLLDRLLRR